MQTISKCLISAVLLAGTTVSTVTAMATPAYAGPVERQIVQQCAYAGVQNEQQMQQCTGGLWVPKAVLDSCMTNGPCFDEPRGGRFADSSGPIWQPNPTQQDAITCYTATGELITGTACSIGAWTRRVLVKCQNGIGNDGGCFGPSNTVRVILTDPRQAGRNLDKSIRKLRKRTFGF